MTHTVTLLHDITVVGGQTFRAGTVFKVRSEVTMTDGSKRLNVEAADGRRVSHLPVEMVRGDEQCG